MADEVMSLRASLRPEPPQHRSQHRPQRTSVSTLLLVALVGFGTAAAALNRNALTAMMRPRCDEDDDPLFQPF